MDETKVIYHIDDEDTPYLVKIPICPEKVTLSDFKNALNRPNYKYFFKSMDDDFGVVKEEIIDDNSILPCFNGRVVSWLVSADGSNQSDGGGSQNADGLLGSGTGSGSGGGGMGAHCTVTAATDCATSLLLPPPVPSFPPPPTHNHHSQFHHRQAPPMLPHPHQSSGDFLCTTDTESIISSRHAGHKRSTAPGAHGLGTKHGGLAVTSRSDYMSNRLYESASILSSDVETTSFQSETSGRHTALSECSSIITNANHHRLQVMGGGGGGVGANRKRPQRRRKQRIPPISRTSSYSSITDSTMSLNIITVTLTMDKVNFLGISIVGQSNKGGDGGIYVGSIMKGGAVALDGRIEPGDMILQVNDVNFENMSNDEAVKVLREVVQKPDTIKLVVAKCWDPNPKGYFTIPRTEPVRPIDPGAWVAHTAAVRGDPITRPGSSSTVSSTSLSSTIAATDAEQLLQQQHQQVLQQSLLSVHGPMSVVVQAMQRPDSGLEIRDRLWLKITIPNAFIGTDMINWLLANVDGFADRRAARKYASQLLKAGFIRHTVNKITFSEQCYYIFGDLCSAMDELLHLDDHHGTDVDTPPHLQASSTYNGSGEGGGAATTSSGGGGGGAATATSALASNYMPYSGTYNPLEYMPMPFYTTSESNTVYGYNKEDSILSGSGASSNDSDFLKEPVDARRISPSESDLTTIGPSGDGSASAVGLMGVSEQRVNNLLLDHAHGAAMVGHGADTTTNGIGTSSSTGNSSSGQSNGTQTTAGGGGGGGGANSNGKSGDLGGSRQSFKMAMGNPCEMFIDVM